MSKSFREEQRIIKEKEREARKKERARARIRREINSFNREISELESLRESFRHKKTDLKGINREWNNDKSTSLRMEMVRDIEVSKKFEGEIATALKNKLPDGLQSMNGNIGSINNVVGGIDHQIESLNKKIGELNSKVAVARKRLSVI
ncbi:MAG TPA: hypothetical protein VK071_10805 [Tissierellales bacterium]|nr:hypothetical protein [Tissierellales bacterium]